MAAAINRYKADLRDFQFVLFEQFGFGEVLGRGPFEEWDVETAKTILNETYRVSREVLGPINQVGDQGCRLENGSVITPKGFQEAYKQLFEAGIKQVSVPKEYGGQGAPYTLHAMIEELTSGANVAFSMYSGLAWGAAEVIAEFGTDAQKKKYAEKMFSGSWGGTMCLTEPHAGSDVGSASTRAFKQADGTYKLQGTKIFISGGDHDLCENIVHLVLARVEGAPAGTKGLSLFIVPKKRVNADGSSGALNDVTVPSIEHKMGINGSATCVLNFGEADGCVGELVGTVEHQGMPQMFRMMNGARIAVGIQGLAITASAYQNALEYAKDRKQGANYKLWKDPKAPRVPIFEHPDVRRMLMELKATTEGIRALLVKLTTHHDRAQVLQGKDDEQVAYHRGQVDLLTPLLKAFSADEAFRLCAQAVQVYGGAGFLKDWPVEQYTRDAKIFSIYEGTTHIQSMDLVGRKLGQAGGANFQAFNSDLMNFIEAHRAHPALGKEVELLNTGMEAFIQVAMGMMGWAQADKGALVALNANRALQMMSQLTVAWLLLDAGVKAHAALPNASGPDKSFYEGKVASAKWYARAVLPQLEAAAKIAALEDTTPIEVSDTSFSTL